MTRKGRFVRHQRLNGNSKLRKLRSMNSNNSEKNKVIIESNGKKFKVHIKKSNSFPDSDSENSDRNNRPNVEMGIKDPEKVREIFRITYNEGKALNHRWNGCSCCMCRYKREDIDFARAELKNACRKIKSKDSF